MKIIILCNSLLFVVVHGLPCIKKDFRKGSFVCACNATYCDSVEPNIPRQPGQFAFYHSSKTTDRFKKLDGIFIDIANHTSELVIHVNRNTTYQSIIGFGGAFTDAAGINIASLSPGVQENLINSYFSSDGIEYNVGRVPMASCDFSTHLYSYDDNSGDFNLTSFALAEEDIKYKIPYIQKAMSISSKKILMFGSPWSAPAWMKTDHNMTSNGTLIGQPGGQYYETWAKYFVKY